MSLRLNLSIFMPLFFCFETAYAQLIDRSIAPMTLLGSAAAFSSSFVGIILGVSAMITIFTIIVLIGFK